MIEEFQTNKCYCPEPIPCADGSICFLCGGDDPEIKKKVKKKRVSKK